jgi:hypothetical protein
MTVYLDKTHTATVLRIPAHELAERLDDQLMMMMDTQLLR